MAGCVDCTVFETKLEELKQSKKRKNSNTLLYTEDNFFDECKRWLQSTPEEKKHLSIDKHTKQKLARNKWSLTCEGKVTASHNKLVVPKRDIYRLLCEAHTATAHRGKDKTERYLRNYYTGISQDVVNLFVSLCKLHQEQNKHLQETNFNSNKNKPVSWSRRDGSHRLPQFAL